MIKNLEHAQEVQARRVKLKKKGVSKAVRRWMQRYVKEHEESKEPSHTYLQLQKILPAIW